jgi:hypothetical protein
VVICDLYNLGDFLSEYALVGVLEGEDDPVADGGLVFLMSAVARYAHDELDFLGVHREVGVVVVLPSLELLLVNHDDAVVLVVGPLFLIVSLALLLAVESFGFAFLAAFADDDSAAILGVAPVVFGDVCEGDATWTPWRGLHAAGTTEGAFQSFWLLNGGCQNKSQL